MEHVLVTLIDKEDLSLIPLVVDYLKPQSPRAVAIMLNPSLGITPESATVAIDKEIADLENAKAQAIQREDFEGAASFKRMIEDKKTSRTTMLMHGWKSVPEDQRAAQYLNLVSPFRALDPTYVTFFALEGDTIYKDLNHSLAMAEKADNWPKCLSPESYSIVKPRSIGVKKAAPQPVQAVSTAPRVETAPKASKPAVEANMSPREARKKELSKYMKLVKVAKDYNITIEKGKSAEAVEKVLAIEFPEAVAA